MRLKKEGPAATMTSERLKTAFKQIIGKSAWFSLNNPHFTILDPEFQKSYPNIANSFYIDHIDSATLEKMIKIFKELKPELDLYKTILR